MLDRQRITEQEGRRDREQMEFQERQETRAEEQHRDQMKQLRGLHTKEMWIVGGVVTLALIAVTFVGAAIEAGWIPKWFGL